MELSPTPAELGYVEGRPEGENSQLKTAAIKRPSFENALELAKVGTMLDICIASCFPSNYRCLVAT